jgi:hypothetical protein
MGVGDGRHFRSQQEKGIAPDYCIPGRDERHG